MGIISKSYNFDTGVIPPDQLNANFDTLYTLINGLLDGLNIAEGGIEADNLSDDISPVTRWDETFRDYVVSGLTVTNVGLDCAVLPGIAYISGERVAPAGTGHTVIDETTSYCDLSSDGTFSWNSNASPVGGYLRLAKIVSTGGDCTITDMRNLAPLNIWDLESVVATAEANTTSGTYATLLTVTMLDVEDGDTLIMVTNGTFQSDTNAAVGSFNYNVGGTDQPLTFEHNTHALVTRNTVTFIGLYAVTADASSLVVNLQWKTSAATLLANHRGLYVLRLRPTR